MCLFGLNIVMPLMTLELLKFPSLCLQYFRTVTLVCEIYPEKVSEGGTEIAQKRGYIVMVYGSFDIHRGGRLNDTSSMKLQTKG